MHHFLTVTLNLQDQDIFTGLEQSLCQILASIYFPLQRRYGLDRNYEFFKNDLEHAQLNLGQNYDTPSGHL